MRMTPTSLPDVASAGSLSIASASAASSCTARGASSDGGVTGAGFLRKRLNIEGQMTENGGMVAPPFRAPIEAAAA